MKGQKSIKKQYNSFLQEIAEKIYSQYGNDLQHIQLVFPNRRAGLFFRQYLSQLIDKPIWSPQLLSIEEFIQKFTSLKAADQISLIFELYQSFKKHQLRDEGFDRFYFWGEMLLRDFDDVDKYLVNPEHIFRGIKSQKELDESFFFLDEENKKTIQNFWQSFLPEASPAQHNFLKTWEVLFPIYQHFRETLIKNNVGYSGLIFREVVENLKTSQYNDKVIFAGFNALTKAEETLIKHFVEHHSAEIYWDYDQYYFEDPKQEAGQFLRQYAADPVLGKTFEKQVENSFNDKDKQVKTVGVSLEIGQTKAAGELLEEFAKDPGFQPEKTVVVLPHEHMLFPILNAIPESIQQLNVTMGYPLKDAPLYTLLDSILHLQESVQLDRDHFVMFYHKPVLEILSHPYLFQSFPGEVDSLMNEVRKKNKVRIQREELNANIPLIDHIFRHISNPNDLSDYLIGIVRFLFESSTEVLGLEKEFLYQFHQSLERLKEILSLQDTKIEHRTFVKLFKQICRSQKIPFTGEPLRGLQIMGVLETRNLDFENVIVLSTNEGSFPAESKKGSFIPFNIRRAFDLPTYLQQDAIYAYLFYRLIQRAKTVHFYYNSFADFGLSGEISRFVSQLELESGLNIQKLHLSNPVKVDSPNEIEIKKTPEILRVLDNYLEGGRSRFSPSALNTYMDCQLRFYYRYIAKLYEPNDVQEEVDAAMFGNILHKAMEEIYEKFTKKKKDKVIQPMDFFGLKGSVDGALQVAFKDHYHLPKGQKFKLVGRNVIIYEIMRRFVLNVLEQDEKYAPFEIISLEGGSREGYKMNVQLNDGRRVGVKGIIDRVDRKQGVVRVLDYKSGADKKEMTTVESFFDPDDNGRNKAAFQIFYYGMLYANLHGESEPIKPGIYNMRELFQDDFDVSLSVKPSKQVVYDVRPYLDEFKKGLTGMFEEIFSAENTFKQTTDLKKCGYCDFKDICKR